MPRPEVPSTPNSYWEEELEIKRKKEDVLGQGKNKVQKILMDKSEISLVVSPLLKETFIHVILST